MKNHRSRHRRFLVTLILLIFITTFITPLLFAEDRVAEGAKDIATGTVAVPKEIAETANESNIINGLVLGTAKGVLNTVKGVTEGVCKILTFYSKND